METDLLNICKTNFTEKDNEWLGMWYPLEVYHIRQEQLTNDTVSIHNAIEEMKSFKPITLKPLL